MGERQVDTGNEKMECEFSGSDGRGAQVTKAISKGEFSKEDFKNLLEVYEDGTEKTKG